ncbi:unnamed protein product [Symbiodinium sp. CCMP2592]|nr:unnamed protein product [Symbiodinium sp. CCMP2592]
MRTQRMFLGAACLAALAMALVQAEDPSCDTPEETVTLLQATHLPQARSKRERLLEDADADVQVGKHDGMKNLENLLFRQPSPETAEATKEAFEKYDKNGDGFLTRDEIAGMLKDFGGGGSEASLEEAADIFISKYDTNGDHKLSFMEVLMHEKY